jgi:hypothetical protein
MAETPPVRLPGHGALLPDGTHLTEEQCQLAVERCLDYIKLLTIEPERNPS